MKLIKAPHIALKPGTIYSADNGERICLHCAGNSAKFTGRDLSGMHVTPMTAADAVEWDLAFAKPLSCERGCTTYGKPGPLKKGERIRIKPEWQDKGDEAREWFVYEDEHDGRLGIFTPLPGMAIQPWQMVSAYMVERVDGGLRDVAIELGLCAS